MSTVNREWHEQHRMPKNATLQQRMDWHLAHSASCSCRPMPAKLREQLEARESQPSKEEQG
jgi:hypothetical protein